LTATEHLDHISLLVATVPDGATATIFRNALAPARKEVEARQAEHLALKSEHATFKSQALHEIALLKETKLVLIAANEKVNAEKLQIAAELAQLKKPKPPFKPNRIETPPGY
jgi:hypothetical protein